jgi:xylan 1,4-beta-xylosidase
MGGKGLDVQQVDLSGIDRGDIKLVGERKVAVDKKNLPAVDGQTWNLEHTEGPWVVRRNGRYYLFFACVTAPPGKPREYWTGVAYSEHPMGPWERDFPRGPHRGIFLGGHLSVFDGPDGRFWYAYKNEKFNPGGDDFLCIDPIDLLPDGRVAYREPTPYDQLVRTGRDGTTTTIEAPPKPPPT